MTGAPSDPVVLAGRAAWQALKQRRRKDFDDWIALARAVRIGRDAALKAAVTDRPYGHKYKRAIADWMRRNGMEDVDQPVRYRLLQILEHLPEIERWRADLDERKRDSLNHPDSLWYGWRRDTMQAVRKHDYAKTRPYRPLNSERLPDGEQNAAPKGSGHPVHWPQDAIRRAAAALRECRSNDCFVIARAMLEAAIRSDADLWAMLQPQSKPASPSDHAHAA